MEFRKILFDGLYLRVPILENGEPWNDWAGSKIETYPDCYCGSGKGFGDKIVPDHIWGVPVSVPCHLHDESWELAPATEEARDLCDLMFLINLKTVVEANSSRLMTPIRNYRVMTYYNVVNSDLNPLFWKLKYEQGHRLPPEILRKVHSLADQVI